MIKALICEGITVSAHDRMQEYKPFLPFQGSIPSTYIEAHKPSMIPKPSGLCGLQALKWPRDTDASKTPIHVIIHLNYMCVWGGGLTHYSMHVEIRGQVVRTSSHLPPCRTKVRLSDTVTNALI